MSEDTRNFLVDELSPREFATTPAFTLSRSDRFDSGIRPERNDRFDASYGLNGNDRVRHSRSGSNPDKPRRFSSGSNPSEPLSGPRERRADRYGRDDSNSSVASDLLGSITDFYEEVVTKCVCAPQKPAEHHQSHGGTNSQSHFHFWQPDTTPLPAADFPTSQGPGQPQKERTSPF